ncbi:MAG: pectate lyase, partial [Chitinivibrionales bacterium]|nr:pectate lyase [Chitinivibrionales bacterium]
MRQISLAIFFLATLAWSATIYVSPNGDDSNDGSEGSPFATLTKARD